MLIFLHHAFCYRAQTLISSKGHGLKSELQKLRESEAKYRFFCLLLLPSLKITVCMTCKKMNLDLTSRKYTNEYGEFSI